MFVTLAAVSFVTIMFLIWRWKSKQVHSKNVNGAANESSVSALCKKFWNYTKVRLMLQEANVALPVMMVDMELFERNVNTILHMCWKNEKKLRIATKSIRCPHLIKVISDICVDVISGFMCYSVTEVDVLYQQGHNDFIVPYPTVQKKDLELALKLSRNGAEVCLTVDSVEQVLKMNKVIEQLQTEHSAGGDINEGKHSNPYFLNVCIDIDMSYKVGYPFNLHLGAHRSSISTVGQFLDLVDQIKSSPYLNLVGVMGYEASVAGLPDQNPHSLIPNFIVKFIKSVFYKHCVSFRSEILKCCFKNRINLKFFNGGGSGNIESVCQDASVTEVTVGSAFLQAQLFDYYRENMCAPACCFALQCTRISPDNSYLCCQSGGFIASGEISKDKQPTPAFNPCDLESFSSEGFGEVQTPLKIKSITDSGLKTNYSDLLCKLGDPILVRPAKSGEIAEHFNSYLLKREYNIVDIVPTYRGLGKVFY